MLSVCFSLLFRDIPRPDESSDQFAVCVFRSSGTAHGVRDLNATPKERRLGSGIWRSGHGKHLWRTNDQRAGEVHDVAGRHFLRAHVRVVGFVRPSGYRRGERVPARANETAACFGYFSRSGNAESFAGFFTSKFTSSGVSRFFPGARGTTNSDAVAAGVSLKPTREAAVQPSYFFPRLVVICDSLRVRRKVR